MKSFLVAVSVAGALTAHASTPPDSQIAAWATSYVKASQAEAIFFDVRDCSATRCIGVYDAPATINGVYGYVQDQYTIRLGRGSAWSLNDDHWRRITKQQVQDDLDGGRPSRRSRG